MALNAGTRLGPYEILAPLGAGGMGEVYRARDTRLARDVAVKVLPEDFLEGEERKQRFEREARLLAALNHPSIAAIYSFEEIPGSPSRHVLAMELVEGETLRARLSGGALPVKKLLAYAAQIAEGLAKAHAAGIVHRDLKPENVMVAKDGGVKILDFGLAKLVERADGEEGMTQSPTVSAATSAGVVLGTVPYLSPEQARGEPLDYRSDQFSFGSMLWEMATGKRAFARASAPETMTAIIREEPEALANAAPGTPVPLRWVVERCLAKERDDRYESTRDLARDLARLKDERSDVLTPSATRPARTLSAGTAAIAAAAALVAGAGVFVAVRRPAVDPPVWRPLTFRRGFVPTARFGPDGRTVVYTAGWQGKPLQIYSTRLDSTESTALPLPSAILQAVSRDGKLAILERPMEQTSVLAEVSLAGSAPRELLELEGGEVADWSPDGRLAVVRNGQLEFPLGHALVSVERPTLLDKPRFSPDGRLIAFVEKRDEDAVAVTDLAGSKKVLAGGFNTLTSLAWHPKTGEIWFSAREGSARFGVVEIRAVTLSGVQRIVARAPTLLHVEDIAPDGGVLVRSDDWPSSTLCLPPGSSREVDVSWLDFSSAGAISSDGRDVLLKESGAAEGSRGAVYMRKTDGSTPAVRLSSGTSDSISPDKKWYTRVTPDRVEILPTGPGEPKTIREEGLEYRAAWFFPDGKRLLVQARPTGKLSRLYVQDIAGASARPVTAAGFGLSAFSPDGKQILANREDGFVLVAVESGEVRPVAGLLGDDSFFNFDATGRGLFVLRPGIPARIERVDLATGKRTPWKEIALPDASGVTDLSSFQITPDGSCYCYSYIRFLSRLYHVEGLR